MRALARILGIAVVVMIAGCTSGTDELDVRESVYTLHQVSTTPINGRVTFTEIDPNTIQIAISLQGTQGEGLPHPAHLHFGTVAESGELALRLNDVDPITGESITVFENQVLSDGQQLNFDLLETINGSIKIHMNVPEGSIFANIAVATGNIGANSRQFDPNSITVCTGH